MLLRPGRVLFGCLLPCLLLGQAAGQTSGENRALRPQQDSSAPVPGEQRVALVIGNGAYRESPLRNPVNDAKAMASALRACGFQVDLILDAGRKQMLDAVRGFGQKLGAGGVGLFYYAGHGMAVRGANYLIPVGADIATEEDVQSEGLDANTVVARMDTAKNRLNLLILDACRNNPFARSFRGGSRGLAQMEAPSGTFIAFATAPGATAADGDGANGLYTQQLLKTLREPGLKVEEVFKKVRIGVKQASHDQQVPWDSSSLTGDFYFQPGTAPVPADPGPRVQDDRARGMFEKGLAYHRGQGLPRNDSEALLQFLQAADLGYAPAMAYLGRMYTFGWGTPVQVRKALEYFQKAAEAGDPLGQNGMGFMYLRGVPEAGIEKDPRQAFRWFQLAAEQGLGIALKNVADAYRLGQGVTPDQGRAVLYARRAQEALVKAADSGDVDAMAWLANLLETGPEAARDLDLAASWYRKAAEQGDAMAQRSLSLMFLAGRGVAKDEAQAATWMRRAAEQGNAQAQNDLGAMCAKGLGLAKSEEQAVLWYRQAAEQGEVHAQYNLGTMLAGGRGVAKSEEQAALWFRKAAEQGLADAQNNLGVLCQSGRGVAKDEAQAVAWYRKAAEQGHMYAQNNLGAMYKTGRGVAADDGLAVIWYRKSAEQGYLQAQYNLGWCCAHGVGTPKDLEQAAVWLKKSADQGNDAAVQELKKLGR
ncbi:MAG: caspase family protein [Geothrix sp.]|nr:caspase family protein [Geothrix sp.]